MKKWTSIRWMGLGVLLMPILLLLLWQGGCLVLRFWPE